MALNYIWIGFFLAGFLVALIRVTGYYFRDFFAEYAGIVFDKADLNIFADIVNNTFTMAAESIRIIIILIGVMTLWLGILKIGEKGGAVQLLSKAVSPLFRKIFPEVPKDHPAIGAMLMNVTANMLGLDNAATPFGLKAMEELQKVNPKKDTASNAQIMFLVLNTSGLTIIPISIMAYRMAEGAANPSDVFLPLLLTTFISTLAGLIAVSVVQRINLLNWIVLLYVGGLSAIIALILFLVKSVESATADIATAFWGNFILFSIVIFFFILGLRKKVNIYEEFIEGAKEGFGVAIRIIPYLVAMLVAIGVFRASGAFDVILAGLAKFFGLFGFDTEFVKALPTALMKPLSGSAARGMTIEIMQHYSADSFAGKLACIFQGSTETTFYTIAVYFGAVNIRRTRYTVTCGLIADLAGIIAAIFVGYIFFS
ncbi:MAG: spore maturation protein [Bacteroidales bacterium]|nr:spore maturation protein [Bacteroidales bacterium]